MSKIKTTIDKRDTAMSLEGVLFRKLALTACVLACLGVTTSVHADSSGFRSGHSSSSGNSSSSGGSTSTVERSYVVAGCQNKITTTLANMTEEDYCDPANRLIDPKDPNLLSLLVDLLTPLAQTNAGLDVSRASLDIYAKAKVQAGPVKLGVLLDLAIPPIKVPAIPRECYRTRLEHQVQNALLCAKLNLAKHPEDKGKDEHDDDVDKDRDKAERETGTYKAEEDDKDNYPTDRKCALDVKLDADGDHDGKDGNEDDDEGHAKDDGHGNKNPNDQDDGKGKRPNYARSDDTPEFGDSGHDQECDDNTKSGCEKYQLPVNLDAKVTICHVPPGNPAKAHTITVSTHSLLNGHMDLAGGGEPHKLHNQDYFGPCVKTAATPNPEPVHKPIVIPKSKIAMVIKEYRDCLDPTKGDGIKTTVDTPTSGGSSSSGAAAADLSGYGGRGSWREIVTVDTGTGAGGSSGTGGVSGSGGSGSGTGTGIGTGAGSSPPTPALPTIPATPALPAIPAIPAIPATPATPAIPATPASPAPGKGGGNN